MTLRGSPDIGFILYAGYDVMGLQTGMSEKLEAMLEQTDGLGDSADEYSAVGMSKFDLSFDGFYDSVITKALEALSAKSAMIYSLISNAIGARAIGVNAVLSSISRDPSRDAITKANMVFKSDEGRDVGQISAPHAIRTAQGPAQTATDNWGTQADAVVITSSSAENPTLITANAVHGLTTGDTVLIAGHSGSTPDINGSHIVTVVNTTTFTIAVSVNPGGTGGTLTRTSTRDGAIAYLVCDNLNLDSGTALQVDIIDSDDDVTFVDLMTFTALTAIGSERKTVAGNIDRYTQTQHEFTGGSGGNRTCKFATVLIRN